MELKNQCIQAIVTLVRTGSHLRDAD